MSGLRHPQHGTHDRQRPHLAAYTKDRRRGHHLPHHAAVGLRVDAAFLGWQKHWPVKKNVIYLFFRLIIKREPLLYSASQAFGLLGNLVHALATPAARVTARPAAPLALSCRCSDDHGCGKGWCHYLFENIPHRRGFKRVMTVNVPVLGLT